MKKETMFQILFGFIAITTLSGCSSTESENVASGGIYVSYSVAIERQQPNRTRADATFYVGGPSGTVLSLNGADSITCNGTSLGKGGDMVGKIYYFGDCGTFTPGATYSFVFRRSGGTFVSSVRLPENLQITSPLDGSIFGRRGQPISLTWDSSSGGSLSLRLTGSGTSSTHWHQQDSYYRSATISDVGSYTIPESWSNPENLTGQISEVTISLERSYKGVIAAGLVGGDIKATSGDTVENGTIVP